MWRKPGAKNALTPVDRLQNPIANRFRCAIQFCNAETEETGSQPICCSNPGLCNDNVPWAALSLMHIRLRRVQSSNSGA